MATENNLSIAKFHKTSDQIRQRIRELIFARGLKDHEAAAKSGMSSPYLSQLLTGARTLKPEHVLDIAKGLHANNGWLITGSGSMDATPVEGITPIEAQGMGFALIPQYAAKAGAGEEKSALSEDPVNLLAFREEWIRSELRRHPKDLFLLTVDGDSMVPTLVPGEIVLVDRTVRKVSSDAIYLVRAFGGIMVKRAELHSDGLHLRSDNPAYHERVIVNAELDETVEILGRVIWGGRRY